MLCVGGRPLADVLMGCVLEPQSPRTLSEDICLKNLAPVFHCNRLKGGTPKLLLTLLSRIHTELLAQDVKVELTGNEAP